MTSTQCVGNKAVVFSMTRGYLLFWRELIKGWCVRMHGVGGGDGVPPSCIAALADF